jgi:ribonuclease E
MSRQRLRPSLGEASQIVCPRCDGHGRMRGIESLALSIIRVAEEHAMKDNTGQVLVQAPVEIANFLLNEKRAALREIEQRHDAPIVIVADEQLHTPHYEVTRVRENELGEETSKPSYQRGTPRKLATIALTKANLNVPVAPVVTNVKPSQPAPMREPRPEPVQAPATPAFVAKPAAPGIVGWLKGLFGGADAAPPSRPADARERGERNERSDRGSQRRDERGNRQGSRDGRDGRGGNRRDERRGQAQGGAQKRQDNKPAQSQQQAQQPKPPRQDKPKQEAQARGQETARQPSQPAQPQQAPKPRNEPAKPREEEVLAKVAVLAPVPTIDPAAEAVQAIATTDAATNIDEQPEHAGDGESAGRRRRGRRGGRRRRKQGAEGGTGDAAIDAGDAEDIVAAPLQSQPEFDFADNRPAPPAAVRATEASLDIANVDVPMQATAPIPPADANAPSAVDTTPAAPPQPEPGLPAPAATLVAVVEPATMTEPTATIEPTLAPDALHGEAAAPVANEVVGAAQPDAIETPAAGAFAIEPVAVALETASAEPADAAADPEADALAKVADEAASGPDAAADAGASREESPLA